MATTFIRNPDNVPGSVVTGYQAQNTVLFASMTGMVNVAIDRGARTINQGSVFELNGNIVRVTEHESIAGALSPNAMHFVYAIPGDYPDGENVTFRFSSVRPTWSETKGGWYRGDANERAIITAITDTNGNIVGTNILTNELDVIVPPNAGGVVAGTWSARTHVSAHLDRGWHRYVIRSGLGGGDGGDGASPGNGAGGVASVFTEIDGVFFHNGGSLMVHVGGNGFDGSASPTAVDVETRGGGGGGGAGEESYIISGSNVYSTERVNPGNGGRGVSIPAGVDPGTGTPFPTQPGANGGIGFLGDFAIDTGGDGGNGGLNRGRFINEISSHAGGAGLGIGGGGGAGATRTIADATPQPGGLGGNGGLPGWTRPLGDPNAGAIRIWRLS